MSPSRLRPSNPRFTLYLLGFQRKVGGKVYAHENLAAYIDFLKESFERFGLPLQIYVDQASFFKSQDGKHLTRLASRLKFYGVTLVFANSPESKGKIERRHQIWQDRLPAHFARIGVPADLDKANSEIWPLVVWNSEHDLNRETGMTGMEAWDKAVRDGRNKLRPKPAEPWWEYVWSVIEPTVVGKGRRVRIGLDEVTVNAPVGSEPICVRTPTARIQSSRTTRNTAHTPSSCSQTGSTQRTTPMGPR